MKWNQGHSLVSGIVVGIAISQRAILLVILGAVLFFILSKFGAIVNAIVSRLNGRTNYIRKL